MPPIIGERRRDLNLVSRETQNTIEHLENHATVRKMLRNNGRTMIEHVRALEDVQNHADERQIAIDQVGVSDLRYPISVLDREQEKQHTVARLSLAVNLPHHFKGTHMSRFIEVLNEHRGEITMRTLPEILRDLKERLDAESARVEVTFPYFLERPAPVSGARALMDYECSFVGEANGKLEDFVLGRQHSHRERRGPR